MSARRLWAILGSVRLAAWLISASILLMVLAVTVPQNTAFDTDEYESFRSDHPVAASTFTALGLDHLFTGWPLAAVTVLLVVNVSVCTGNRIRARRRTFRGRADVSGDAAFPGRADVEDLLKRHGWTVYADVRGLLAVKGRSGFWGSMVLHASLLVLAAGGILTVLTSFHGEMVLTEGESLYDQRDAYAKVYKEPQLGEAYSGALVSQGGVKTEYVGDVLVTVASDLRVLDEGGALRSKAVRVNHPLDAAGKSFLLLNSGYAAALVVGVDGSDPVPLVLRLAEETPGGWLDSKEVPLSDGRVGVVRVLATPVPLERGEKLPVRKFEFSDPRIRVELLIDGEVVDEEVLAEGESADLGGEVDLTFEDLRFWNRYLVRGEPGRWLTYIGLWMSVIGTAWRFGVPERRIVVTGARVGQAATVAYRSRPWRPFASSDQSVVTQIRDMVGATSDL